MERSGLVPVMAVAIVNGIFSPWVLVIFVLYMASALILSTLTMMVSGVAAALYQRLASSPSTSAIAWIWIAGTVLLTLPSVPNVLRALGF
jgi:hypothetical protein